MTIINADYYNLTASLRRHIIDETGLQTDIIYDGYKYPTTRPLVTIDQMQFNQHYNVKRREAVTIVYRWQIGIHASNYVEQTKLADVLNDVLTFKDVDYYDFNKSATDVTGVFDVDITALVPMPSDDIAKDSRRFTTYLDVETTITKRKK